MEATSLVAVLQKTLGVEARATPGGRGQFDVLADDKLIWSKHERGRFPESAEIVSLLGTSD